MAEITSTDYLKALLQHYDIKDIRDAIQGARTDEEAKYLLQKALLGVDADGNVLPAMKPEVAELTKDWPKRENQITVPFTTQVLKDLGYPMDKENIDSSYAQFVKDYPRKKEGFKSILSGKPYGSHGYADDILQNAFRAAVKDRAQADLQKLRDDAMSAHLNDPYSWYASAIGHTLLRNMYKAGQEGRDPTLADVASDAAEDILFAVPGGQYAKWLQLTRLAQLGKGGSYAARILGESVAPFANEAAQYGLHSSDALEETGINPYDEDMFHEQERTSEATFSPERAAMGTLTNNAVGIGLYRAGAKAAPVVTGELSRGASSKALREGVQGGKTAGEIVQEAEQTARTAQKFKAEDGFSSFLAGESKGLDKAAMSDAEGVLRFKARAKDLKVPEGIPSYVDNFDGYVETLLDYNGITGGERELFKRTLTAHPKLATLIKTTDKGVQAKRMLNSALSNSGAARAEIVNKYGSQKEANIATGMLGLGGKYVDDILRKPQDERILKNKRAIENRQILAQDGLDETDKKYLEMVFKNPKMLQFDSNADTGFKLWLVTRGNDILRGTSYFRPAFAVEEK